MFVLGNRNKVCVVCVFVKVQCKFKFVFECWFVYTCVEIFDIKCLMSYCILVFLVCEVEFRY